LVWFGLGFDFGWVLVLVWFGIFCLIYLRTAKISLALAPGSWKYILSIKVIVPGNIFY